MFYGFILGGICFLMCAQFFGVDKTRRVNGVRIKGGSNGDFVEKYFPAKIEFCRKSFEIIMTLIIITEYYTRTLAPQWDQAEESFLPSMIVLVVYGMVTVAENFILFTHQTSKDKKNIIIFVILHTFRTLLMAVSAAMFFTTNGREVQFGFWILTNLCVFLTQVMWSTYSFLREFYAKNSKVDASSDVRGVTDIHEVDPSYDGSAHEGNPDYVHTHVTFLKPLRRSN